ncbi:MAG: ornithine carbamoyltransferase [Thermostichales cyanobacterium HHBFW_bins_127]
MNGWQGRDLLTLADLRADQVQELLQTALALKHKQLQPHLAGRILGLLFRKASTRTRVSFTAAMAQCGGTVIDLLPDVMQVSRGEPIEDTARVLDRYVDVLAIRTFAQQELETFAHYARIPVINALTDRFHPCQALADLLTIQEYWGALQGVVLTYCGDGNNVAHSLLLGAALTGMEIRVATPADFAPDPEVVARAEALAQQFQTGARIRLTTDPQEAAVGAQVFYTDVWASMGQEEQAQQRYPQFVPYQLNEALLALGDPKAMVLHCLPAHRGEEITAAVLEGSQSRVWEQAENRLHVQKALIVHLLGAV